MTINQRIEALEKEVSVLRAGLRIILDGMFGSHEGEKTTDQMTPAEQEAELDRILAEIFQGQESLPTDEALARALAVEFVHKGANPFAGIPPGTK